MKHALLYDSDRRSYSVISNDPDAYDGEDVVWHRVAENMPKSIAEALKTSLDAGGSDW